MNKDVEAVIIAEDQGEFTRYTAIAENKSLAEQNLAFEFSKFTKSDSGEVAKDSIGGSLFLSAQERTKLTDITVSKSENRRIIILLALYNQEGKPIGQSRIVLNDDALSEKRIVLKNTKPEQALQNQDMAAPQDGFFLEGLIVENTITKMGRDFHRLFYSKYYLSGVKSGKNIIIDELPFRARTTRISVKVEDQVVWQFFANPSQDFLKKQADYAFKNVVAQLRQISNTKESITKY